MTEHAFTVRQIGEIQLGDGEDIVGVALEGSHEAVRASGKFFGEKVTLSALYTLAPSAEAAQPVAEPVEWLWFGEAGGEQHISFGRWQNHKSQYRYKYADIQATEHDHHAQPQGELREVLDPKIQEKIRTFLLVRESARADDYPWAQLNDATDIFRAIVAALAGRTAG